MSLFKLQRVRTPWQRALGLLATVALILLTVQPAWSAALVISNKTVTKDKPLQFHLEADARVLSNWAANERSVAVSSGFLNLSHSEFWSIGVSFVSKTFDYRQTDPTKITKFDGVHGFQTGLFATHQAPHVGETAKTHTPVESEPPRKKNDNNKSIQATASIIEEHDSHRDIISDQLRFKVKNKNGAETLNVSDVITDELDNVNKRELIVNTRHNGFGEMVAAGPTFGSTQTTVAFFYEGSDFLMVTPGPNDIASDLFTTTAGTGTYADDAVVGGSLPSLIAVRTGVNNGIHSFTPTFNQFSFAAGDSIMHGTWDGFEIDTATGLVQALISEFHFTEGVG